ncbi:MAG: RnfABCDGE type electron transport complex subunit D [Ignavibacteria bacterium]|nr:RnfABCDGE type electron transport complex subunit D [Ignavibacteria bacterium]
MTTANPTYRLELTSSPHVHSRWSTRQAMWLVILSLLPPLAAALVFYGIYQLLVIFVSVIFCVGTEVLIKLIRKREITVKDGSAVITGLLLALTLPPNFSLIFTAIGGIFAIAIGKEIFGGLGYNIFNPALVGRAFLQAAFPVAMTTWTIPNFSDAVSKATPLSSLKFDGILTALEPMFVGNIGGSLGETSAFAVLIGGLFLLVLGVANWRIPLSMFFGVLVFGSIFWFINPVKYPTPFFHLFAGSFMFGAFFMATDWVTSPLTGKGMWIFGLGISLVVVVIRIFGGLPEGVMYGILLMNAFVPIINRYTKPKVFGEIK